jgi:hypothetical protein
MATIAVMLTAWHPSQSCCEREQLMDVPGHKSRPTRKGCEWVPRVCCAQLCVRPCSSNHHDALRTHATIAFCLRSEPVMDASSAAAAARGRGWQHDQQCTTGQKQQQGKCGVRKLHALILKLGGHRLAAQPLQCGTTLSQCAPELQ